MNEKKLTILNINRTKIFLLLPFIIFACYKNGFIPFQKNLVTILYVFKPLVLSFLSILIAFIIEFIISFYKKESFSENIYNSSLPYYGLLYSLIIPANINPYLYILLLTITLFLSKIKINLINPISLGKVLFILSALLVNSYSYQNIYEKTFTVSYNILDILFGKIPGGSGSTSALLSIIIFLILLTRKYYKKEITIAMILSFSIISLLSSFIFKSNLLSPIFESELLFTSIFIAPLANYSPYTNKGKIVYGISIGIIGFILCQLINIKEGLYISILILSAISKIFDKIENR